jgi:hypothetical protein
VEGRRDRPRYPARRDGDRHDTDLRPADDHDSRGVEESGYGLPEGQATTPVADLDRASPHGTTRNWASRFERASDARIYGDLDGARPRLCKLGTDRLDDGAHLTPHVSVSGRGDTVLENAEAEHTGRCSNHRCAARNTNAPSHCGTHSLRAGCEPRRSDDLTKQRGPAVRGLWNTRGMGVPEATAGVVVWGACAVIAVSAIFAAFISFPI